MVCEIASQVEYVRPARYSTFLAHYLAGRTYSTCKVLPLISSSLILYVISFTAIQYCSWFDWSALYNLARPVKTNAKDLSAAVIHTILENKQKKWDNPKSVINMVCHLIPYRLFLCLKNNIIIISQVCLLHLETP